MRPSPPQMPQDSSAMGATYSGLAARALVFLRGSALIAAIFSSRGAHSVTARSRSGCCRVSTRGALTPLDLRWLARLHVVCPRAVRASPRSSFGLRIGRARSGGVRSPRMSEFALRPIRFEDDPAVAAIIRTVMPEYGAVGEGFAIQDPEVDFISRAYEGQRACYFVVERDGRVVGGGGVGPLAGEEESVCELRKMYFLKEARGSGMGETLVRRCIEEARKMGYRTMYLETLTGMDAAQKLYVRLGFERLSEPMGATGHHGCNRFYALGL